MIFIFFGFKNVNMKLKRSNFQADLMKISEVRIKWTLILFPKLEPNEIFAEVISYDTKLFYK